MIERPDDRSIVVATILTDEVVEALPAILRRNIDMVCTRPADRIDDDSMMELIGVIVGVQVATVYSTCILINPLLLSVVVAIANCLPCIIFSSSISIDYSTMSSL